VKSEWVFRMWAQSILRTSLAMGRLLGVFSASVGILEKSATGRRGGTSLLVYLWPAS